MDDEVIADHPRLLLTAVGFTSQSNLRIDDISVIELP
jgi:hypothetical protein